MGGREKIRKTEVQEIQHLNRNSRKKTQNQRKEIIDKQFKKVPRSEGWESILKRLTALRQGSPLWNFRTLATEGRNRDTHKGWRLRISFRLPFPTRSKWQSNAFKILKEYKPYTQSSIRDQGIFRHASPSKNYFPCTLLLQALYQNEVVNQERKRLHRKQEIQQRTAHKDSTH